MRYFVLPRRVAACLLALLLALAVAMVAQAGDPDATDPRQRIVYHINVDDPAHHLNALQYLQSHFEAVGAGAMQARVVLHGGGIHLLEYAHGNVELRGLVDVLKLQGVEFRLCGNTMESRGVRLDELYDAEPADRVPSGLSELMRLQREGYTYIKP